MIADSKTKAKVDVSQELTAVSELMEAVLSDTSVPRNIRAVVDEALKKISSLEEKAVAVSTAIYQLDDISNDINMPSHTRTEIWGIISELESIKEKLK
ncbi:MAG: UPF0147 family protein [Candidatus Diapherotrites archaeon]|nr:UPF0147 family protein [Candidatus Diapherotrites archaeon]